MVLCKVDSDLFARWKHFVSRGETVCFKVANSSKSSSRYAFANVEPMPMLPAGNIEYVQKSADSFGG